MIAALEIDLRLGIDAVVDAWMAGTSPAMTMFVGKAKGPRPRT